MAQDVGSFLVNTTRLAAIAWSWVASKDDSPHLFKVDTQQLHDSWRRYCHTGIDRILEVESYGVPPRDDDRIFDLYASAIACSVGGWRCDFKEGRYHQFKKGGTLPHDLPGFMSFDPKRDAGLGCLMDPLTANTGCMTTVYELRARAVFDDLRARQYDALSRTVLCAYVRKSWAAFRDPGLVLKLDKMRGILLNHPDRMHVRLEDVPTEEMHDGENLRKLLIRSGVQSKRTPGSFAAARKGLEDVPDSPPVVGGADAAMPFGGIVAKEVVTPVWYENRKLWTGVGLTAAAGLASFAWGRYRSR